MFPASPTKENAAAVSASDHRYVTAIEPVDQDPSRQAYHQKRKESERKDHRHQTGVIGQGYRQQWEADQREAVAKVRGAKRRPERPEPPSQSRSIHRPSLNAGGDAAGHRYLGRPVVGESFGVLVAFHVRG